MTIQKYSYDCFLNLHHELLNSSVSITQEIKTNNMLDAIDHLDEYRIHNDNIYEVFTNSCSSFVEKIYTENFLGINKSLILLNELLIKEVKYLLLHKNELISEKNQIDEENFKRDLVDKLYDEFLQQEKSEKDQNILLYFNKINMAYKLRTFIDLYSAYTPEAHEIILSLIQIDASKITINYIAILNNFEYILKSSDPYILLKDYFVGDENIINISLRTYWICLKNLYLYFISYNSHILQILGDDFKNRIFKYLDNVICKKESRILNNDKSNYFLNIYNFFDAFSSLIISKVYNSKVIILNENGILISILMNTLPDRLIQLVSNKYYSDTLIPHRLFLDFTYLSVHNKFSILNSLKNFGVTSISMNNTLFLPFDTKYALSSEPNALYYPSEITITSVTSKENETIKKSIKEEILNNSKKTNSDKDNPSLNHYKNIGDIIKAYDGANLVTEYHIYRLMLDVAKGNLKNLSLLFSIEIINYIDDHCEDVYMEDAESNNYSSNDNEGSDSSKDKNKEEETEITKNVEHILENDISYYNDIDFQFHHLKEKKDEYKDVLYDESIKNTSNSYLNNSEELKILYQSLSKNEENKTDTFSKQIELDGNSNRNVNRHNGKYVEPIVIITKRTPKGKSKYIANNPRNINNYTNLEVNKPTKKTKEQSYSGHNDNLSFPSELSFLNNESAYNHMGLNKNEIPNYFSNIIKRNYEKSCSINQCNIKVDTPSDYSENVTDHYTSPTEMNFSEEGHIKKNPETEKKNEKEQNVDKNKDQNMETEHSMQFNDSNIVINTNSDVENKLKGLYEFPISPFQNINKGNNSNNASIDSIDNKNTTLNSNSTTNSTSDDTYFEKNAREMLNSAVFLKDICKKKKQILNIEKLRSIEELKYDLLRTKYGVLYKNLLFLNEKNLKKIFESTFFDSDQMKDSIIRIMSAYEIGNLKNILKVNMNDLNEYFYQSKNIFKNKKKILSFFSLNTNQNVINKIETKLYSVFTIVWLHYTNYLRKILDIFSQNELNILSNMYYTLMVTNEDNHHLSLLNYFGFTDVFIMYILFVGLKKNIHYINQNKSYTIQNKQFRNIDPIQISRGYDGYYYIFKNMVAAKILDSSQGIKYKINAGFTLNFYTVNNIDKYNSESMIKIKFELSKDRKISLSKKILYAILNPIKYEELTYNKRDSSIIERYPSLVIYRKHIGDTINDISSLITVIICGKLYKLSEVKACIETKNVFPLFSKKINSIIHNFYNNSISFKSTAFILNKDSYNIFSNFYHNPKILMDTLIQYLKGMTQEIKKLSNENQIRYNFSFVYNLIKVHILSETTPNNEIKDYLFSLEEIIFKYKIYSQKIATSIVKLSRKYPGNPKFIKTINTISLILYRIKIEELSSHVANNEYPAFQNEILILDLMDIINIVVFFNKVLNKIIKTDELERLVDKENIIKIHIDEIIIIVEKIFNKCENYFYDIIDNNIRNTIINILLKKMKLTFIYYKYFFDNNIEELSLKFINNLKQKKSFIMFYEPNNYYYPIEISYDKIKDFEQIFFLDLIEYNYSNIKTLHNKYSIENKKKEPKQILLKLIKTTKSISLLYHVFNIPKEYNDNLFDIIFDIVKQSSVYNTFVQKSRLWGHNVPIEIHFKLYFANFQKLIRYYIESDKIDKLINSMLNYNESDIKIERSREEDEKIKKEKKNDLYSCIKGQWLYKYNLRNMKIYLPNIKLRINLDPQDIKKCVNKNSRYSHLGKLTDIMLNILVCELHNIFNAQKKMNLLFSTMDIEMQDISSKLLFKINNILNVKQKISLFYYSKNALMHFTEILSYHYKENITLYSENSQNGYDMHSFKSQKRQENIHKQIVILKKGNTFRIYEQNPIFQNGVHSLQNEAYFLMHREKVMHIKDYLESLERTYSETQISAIEDIHLVIVNNINDQTDINSIHKMIDDLIKHKDVGSLKTSILENLIDLNILNNRNNRVRDNYLNILHLEIFSLFSFGPYHNIYNLLDELFLYDNKLLNWFKRWIILNKNTYYNDNNNFNQLLFISSIKYMIKTLSMKISKKTLTKKYFKYIPKLYNKKRARSIDLRFEEIKPNSILKNEIDYKKENYDSDMGKIFLNRVKEYKISSKLRDKILEELDKYKFSISLDRYKQDYYFLSLVGLGYSYINKFSELKLGLYKSVNIILKKMYNIFYVTELIETVNVFVNVIVNIYKNIFYNNSKYIIENGKIKLSKEKKEELAKFILLEENINIDCLHNHIYKGHKFFTHDNFDDTNYSLSNNEYYLNYVIQNVCDFFYSVFNCFHDNACFSKNEKYAKNIINIYLKKTGFQKNMIWLMPFLSNHFKSSLIILYIEPNDTITLYKYQDNTSTEFSIQILVHNGKMSLILPTYFIYTNIIYMTTTIFVENERHIRSVSNINTNNNETTDIINSNMEPLYRTIQKCKLISDESIINTQKANHYYNTYFDIIEYKLNALASNKIGLYNFLISIREDILNFKYFMFYKNLIRFLRLMDILLEVLSSNMQIYSDFIYFQDILNTPSSLIESSINNIITFLEKENFDIFTRNQKKKYYDILLEYYNNYYYKTGVYLKLLDFILNNIKTDLEMNPDFVIIDPNNKHEQNAKQRKIYMLKNFEDLIICEHIKVVYNIMKYVEIYIDNIINNVIHKTEKENNEKPSLNKKKILRECCLKYDYNELGATELTKKYFSELERRFIKILNYSENLQKLSNEELDYEEWYYIASKLQLEQFKNNELIYFKILNQDIFWKNGAKKCTSEYLKRLKAKGLCIDPKNVKLLKNTKLVFSEYKDTIYKSKIIRNGTNYDSMSNTIDENINSFSLEMISNKHHAISYLWEFINIEICINGSNSNFENIKYKLKNNNNLLKYMKILTEEDIYNLFIAIITFHRLIESIDEKIFNKYKGYRISNMIFNELIDRGIYIAGDSLISREYVESIFVYNLWKQNIKYVKVSNVLIKSPIPVKYANYYSSSIIFKTLRFVYSKPKFKIKLINMLSYIIYNIFELDTIKKYIINTISSEGILRGGFDIIRQILFKLNIGIDGIITMYTSIFINMYYIVENCYIQDIIENIDYRRMFSNLFFLLHNSIEECYIKILLNLIFDNSNLLKFINKHDIKVKDIILKFKRIFLLNFGIYINFFQHLYDNIEAKLITYIKYYVTKILNDLLSININTIEKIFHTEKENINLLEFVSFHDEENLLLIYTRIITLVKYESFIQKFRTKAINKHKELFSKFKQIEVSKTALIDIMHKKANEIANYKKKKFFKRHIKDIPNQNKAIRSTDAQNGLLSTITTYRKDTENKSVKLPKLESSLSSDRNKNTQEIEIYNIVQTDVYRTLSCLEKMFIYAFDIYNNDNLSKSKTKICSSLHSYDWIKGIHRVIIKKLNNITHSVYGYTHYLQLFIKLNEVICKVNFKINMHGNVKKNKYIYFLTKRKYKNSIVSYNIFRRHNQLCFLLIKHRTDNDKNIHICYDAEMIPFYKINNISKYFNDSFANINKLKNKSKIHEHAETNENDNINRNENYKYPFNLINKNNTPPKHKSDGFVQENMHSEMDQQKRGKKKKGYISQINNQEYNYPKRESDYEEDKNISRRSLYHRGTKPKRIIVNKIKRWRENVNNKTGNNILSNTFKSVKKPLKYMDRKAEKKKFKKNEKDIDLNNEYDNIEKINNALKHFNDKKIINQLLEFEYFHSNKWSSNIFNLTIDTMDGDNENIKLILEVGNYNIKISYQVSINSYNNKETFHELNSFINKNNIRSAITKKLKKYSKLNYIIKSIFILNKNIKNVSYEKINTDFKSDINNFDRKNIIKNLYSKHSQIYQRNIREQQNKHNMGKDKIETNTQVLEILKFAWYKNKYERSTCTLLIVKAINPLILKGDYSHDTCNTNENIENVMKFIENTEVKAESNYGQKFHNLNDPEGINGDDDDNEIIQSKNSSEESENESDSDSDSEKGENKSDSGNEGSGNESDIESETENTGLYKMKSKMHVKYKQHKKEKIQNIKRNTREENYFSNYEKYFNKIYTLSEEEIFFIKRRMDKQTAMVKYRLILLSIIIIKSNNLNTFKKMNNISNEYLRDKYKRYKHIEYNQNYLFNKKYVYIENKHYIIKKKLECLMELEFYKILKISLEKNNILQQFLNDLTVEVSDINKYFYKHNYTSNSNIHSSSFYLDQLENIKFLCPILYELKNKEIIDLKNTSKIDSSIKLTENEKKNQLIECEKNVGFFGSNISFFGKPLDDFIGKRRIQNIAMFTYECEKSVFNGKNLSELDNYHKNFCINTIQNELKNDDKQFGNINTNWGDMLFNAFSSKKNNNNAGYNYNEIKCFGFADKDELKKYEKKKEAKCQIDILNKTVNVLQNLIDKYYIIKKDGIHNGNAYNAYILYKNIYTVMLYKLMYEARSFNPLRIQQRLNPVGNNYTKLLYKKNKSSNFAKRIIEKTSTLYLEIELIYNEHDFLRNVHFPSESVDILMQNHKPFTEDAYGYGLSENPNKILNEGEENTKLYFFFVLSLLGHYPEVQKYILQASESVDIIYNLLDINLDDIQKNKNTGNQKKKPKYDHLINAQSEQNIYFHDQSESKEEIKKQTSREKSFFSSQHEAAYNYLFPEGNNQGKEDDKKAGDGNKREKPKIEDFVWMGKDQIDNIKKLIVEHKLVDIFIKGKNLINFKSFLQNDNYLEAFKNSLENELKKKDFCHHFIKTTPPFSFNNYNVHHLLLFAFYYGFSDIIRIRRLYINLEYSINRTIDKNKYIYSYRTQNYIHFNLEPEKRVLLNKIYEKIAKFTYKSALQHIYNNKNRQILFEFNKTQSEQLIDIINTSISKKDNIYIYTKNNIKEITNVIKIFVENYILVLNNYPSNFGLSKHSSLYDNFVKNIKKLFFSFNQQNNIIYIITQRDIYYNKQVIKNTKYKENITNIIKRLLYFVLLASARPYDTNSNIKNDTCLNEKLSIGKKNAINISNVISDITSDISPHLPKLSTVNPYSNIDTATTSNANFIYIKNPNEQQYSFLEETYEGGIDKNYSQNNILSKNEINSLKIVKDKIYSFSEDPRKKKKKIVSKANLNSSVEESNTNSRGKRLKFFVLANYLYRKVQNIYSGLVDKAISYTFTYGFDLFVKNSIYLYNQKKSLVYKYIIYYVKMYVIQTLDMIFLVVRDSELSVSLTNIDSIKHSIFDMCLFNIQNLSVLSKNILNIISEEKIEHILSDLITIIHINYTGNSRFIENLIKNINLALSKNIALKKMFGDFISYLSISSIQTFELLFHSKYKQKLINIIITLLNKISKTISNILEESFFQSYICTNIIRLGESFISEFNEENTVYRFLMDIGDINYMDIIISYAYKYFPKIVNDFMQD
ncbi:conserved Plasmodium protein, unknown function [Plasmodium berghei]|uniref:Uncharacterized protein n=3 Tax=Plasmodium berghei TaxID=5821 RepID=A0A509AQ93_PLABA|nr:conserved Plasmodium protein, unknown function [Plasmodium berghei ANKA]SCN25562.1 conserved Plasmodium protein, unknown function [Plasmodium berghei]SCO60514.1 conserved Plasmodium protein, unknown function [Plasmodium berghei]VUC55887.1 conserved Plasmodium protein, unknown function [Plasmodium berghei ANKA]|eukprot:XP_034421697.1 conserved Plasmodium protein, unknown function [Plasmodium berghei ANKA]